MPALLFEPLTLRGLTLPDRIVVSPMCQYQAVDGLATDWHLMHLGELATGAGGLLILEATGVAPEARITPGCLGLWSDAHVKALERPLAFCRKHGQAKLGIQLAHAGRKASCHVPLDGGGSLRPDQGAWQTISASTLPFGDWHTPRAATLDDIARIKADFVAAAGRAEALGLDLVELHMAHGYLMHQFLSPLTNHREDGYGGSLANRMRLPLETFEAVRAAWPADKPLGVRVSATDWVEGGWDLAQTIAFAGELKARGCDYIDVSSGGNDPGQKIRLGPGYQVPFGAEVRAATDMPVMTVGLITDPHQAEAILAEGKADLVALARGVMDDPRWAWHAARALGVQIPYPPMYARCHTSVWRPVG